MLKSTERWLQDSAEAAPTSIVQSALNLVATVASADLASAEQLTSGAVPEILGNVLARCDTPSRPLAPAVTHTPCYFYRCCIDSSSPDVATYASVARVASCMTKTKSLAKAPAAQAVLRRTVRTARTADAYTADMSSAEATLQLLAGAADSKDSTALDVVRDAGAEQVCQPSLPCLTTESA